MAARQQSVTLEQQLSRSLNASRPGATLRCWYQRWSQRRALARLDAHRLNDIGISPEQAEAEMRKPFWQA